MLQQLAALFGFSGIDANRIHAPHPREVYERLGASFFTRRLSPRVRRSRIRRLTKAEREVAREQGWIA